MAHTDPTRIRTTISVDRDVHDIFVKMAEAAGMSVSRCMGEWLADTAEGAQFVAQKVVEARQSPMLVMREMQAYSVGLTEEVDKTIHKMRQEQRRVPPRSGGPASAPAAAVAPSSHTGLKSPRKTPKPSPKATSRGAK
jgi:hypothetical protein